jgi:acetyl esterase
MSDTPSPEPPSPWEAARQAAVGKSIQVALSGISQYGRFFHPGAQSWRRGVEVARDIPYRRKAVPGDAHLLDVYRPEGVEGPLPVMVYIHGGGFRILSKDSHWMFGCGFAKRGFLVFNVNYTLSTAAPYPSAVKDVFAAFQWIVANAASYGGDLGRLVFAGESAGANLALGLMIACCWKRPEPWAQDVWRLGHTPDVILPACGFNQVSDPARYLTNHNIPMWIRDRIAQICRSYLPDDQGDWESLALADPLVWLEQAGPPDRPLPALFAPCGADDPVVDDTRRLGAAMRRFPVRSDAPIYPKAHHAFHAFVWQDAARACWEDMTAFLKDVLPDA